MKVLFCKVSYMKYYKGVSANDVPFNGGSFVKENGYGNEEYNFKPVTLDGTERCFGFVETKSTGANRANQLHIEKIDGCELCKKEPSVDDVLVIWCATRDRGDAVVVGWYKHATVYRNYEEVPAQEAMQAYGRERHYNILAEAKNCVLLPYTERNRYCWRAKTAKQTRSYGFGQSMVWYANEYSAQGYIAELIESMDNYRGENHLYLSE